MQLYRRPGMIAGDPTENIKEIDHLDQDHREIDERIEGLDASDALFRVIIVACPDVLKMESRENWGTEKDRPYDWNPPLLGRTYANVQFFMVPNASMITP